MIILSAANLAFKLIVELLETDVQVPSKRFYITCLKSCCEVRMR